MADATGGVSDPPAQRPSGREAPASLGGISVLLFIVVGVQEVVGTL